MTSRRGFLAGAAATAILPGALHAATPPPGETSWALIDVASGAVLDQGEPMRPMIPASTIKCLTACATLGAYAPDARFKTYIYADGALDGGVLQGDLHLVGGGDPSIDTNDLEKMVSGLRESGLRKVNGRFFYNGGALPELPILNPMQPHQAGYNPGISGLNLNFNRVLMRWRARGAGLESVAMADGKIASAASVDFRASAAAQDFAYRHDEGLEVWTVPKSWLGQPGRRWLPVRDPALYTASVFHALCQETGLALPEPEPTTSSPVTEPLAIHRSDSAYGLLVKMLKFSNNLTAEAMGLAAAHQFAGRPEDLNAAARTTTDWLRREFALGDGIDIENHSGLSSHSRIAPMQLVQVLRGGVQRFGRGFVTLHPKSLVSKAVGSEAPGAIWAKTGTMHFVRGLSGFMEVEGRLLAFAILSSDPAERAKADAAFRPFADMRPRGASRWRNHALGFERALLKKWAVSYGA